MNNLFNWENAFYNNDTFMYKALIRAKIPISPDIFLKFVNGYNGVIENIPKYITEYAFEIFIQVIEDSLTIDQKEKRYAIKNIWSNYIENFKDKMEIEAYTAALTNNTDILKVLKFFNYKFNDLTLHFAATDGMMEAVRWLQENTDVVPYITTSYTCIKNGHAHIAVFLVKHYPKHCVKYFNIQYAKKYDCLDMFEEVYVYSTIVSDKQIENKNFQDSVWTFISLL
jgi:hypothetical protein